MKRLLSLILIFVFLFLPKIGFATGSFVTQSMRQVGSDIVVTLLCKGDASNGTVPSTLIKPEILNKVMGMYLYVVIAYPSPGGTAPDAADVTVTMKGMDLLGAKGVNLIHATSTLDTFPYSAFMTAYRYPKITGPITIAVANQATASADWTIELIFVR
jgi:hypothetical protein